MRKIQKNKKHSDESQENTNKKNEVTGHKGARNTNKSIAYNRKCRYIFF